MRNILIAIIFISIGAQAFTLEIVTADKSKNSNLADEVKLIQQLIDCAKLANEEKGLSCIKDLTSPSIDSVTIKRILAWFQQNAKLTELVTCSESKIKFIPDENKVGVSKFLCGSYVVKKKRQDVRFSIGTTDANSLKLVYIKF